MIGKLAQGMGLLNFLLFKLYLYLTLAHTGGSGTLLDMCITIDNKYLKVTIIYGYKIVCLKIVDLAGINFSDFAITCSINSKMCDKF